VTPTGIQPDERSLIEAAQKDPARFLDLYERHFHRVWAYVIRRTRNRHEAEDITSDVFRQGLANIAKFEWRGVPFSAWLLRIAANSIASRWEKAGRDVDEMPPESAAEDDDLERRAMLAQLVERLPGAQRKVIEMRFVEEKSIREIAEAMKRTEGAVKQLQLRALENLRASIERKAGRPA
jgi:RNA polymerase sigma-70 factor (ECF subfamily)